MTLGSNGASLMVSDAAEEPRLHGKARQEQRRLEAARRAAASRIEPAYFYGNPVGLLIDRSKIRPATREELERISSLRSRGRPLKVQTAEGDWALLAALTRRYNGQDFFTSDPSCRDLVRIVGPAPR